MRRTALTPVAILVAVLAVMVLAVVIAGPGASAADDPASTANGRAGTLALYDWLPATGAGVHRIYSEFDLGGTDVLISADPLDDYAYTSGDDATLTAFLDGGGEVILAVSDPTSVAAVLDPLGIAAQPSDLIRAAPAQPFPGSAGVSSVPLTASGEADLGKRLDLLRR